MRRFVQLFDELNASNRTQHKLDALADYFRGADARDAIWALYFLTGRKLKSLASSKQLRQWVADIAELPVWLVERSYEVAGDLAETLSLLLPDLDDSENPSEIRPLYQIIEDTLIPLRERSEASKFEVLREQWSLMNSNERFVFNKLMTGGFRIGASRTLVERALAQALELPQATVTHRLTGDWKPSLEVWERLKNPKNSEQDQAAPYVFTLAYPLEERSIAKEGRSRDDVLARLQSLGPIEDWLIEWKWDGIRAQILRRGDIAMLWSRGEERVHEMFPEITDIARSLPAGTVLDGEIVNWDQDRVGSFSKLQHRIGRKKVSEKILRDYPCIFIAYDVLEYQGRDLRELKLAERREILEHLISGFKESPRIANSATKRDSQPIKQSDFLIELGQVKAEPEVSRLKCSEIVETVSWESSIELRETARDRRVEGFMLKRKASKYVGGRVKGDWWKWKLDPYSIDCVMLYAQAGHGRRAGLYTDFTFGVIDGDGLVPVAKAYSGLSDDEFKKVDAWIKKNTLSKRGPVRMVRPELVFELAFENIHLSDRHRSGVALRFPRIARWRHDKSHDEVDTLESLKALID
ncbi:MAG: ATP-dependent DNA ligase [Verrucomicrobiota bacterium]